MVNVNETGPQIAVANLGRTVTLKTLQWEYLLKLDKETYLLKEFLVVYISKDTLQVQFH